MCSSLSLLYAMQEHTKRYDLVQRVSTYVMLHHNKELCHKRDTYRKGGDGWILYDSRTVVLMMLVNS